MHVSLPLELPISWLVLPFPVVLVCYACLVSASASSNRSYIPTISDIWWEILPALRILYENTAPEYCRSLVLNSLCVHLQLLVEGPWRTRPEAMRCRRTSGRTVPRQRIDEIYRSCGAIRGRNRRDSLSWDALLLLAALAAT